MEFLNRKTTDVITFNTQENVVIRSEGVVSPNYRAGALSYCKNNCYELYLEEYIKTA